MEIERGRRRERGMGPRPQVDRTALKVRPPLSQGESPTRTNVFLSPSSLGEKRGDRSLGEDGLGSLGDQNTVITTPNQASDCTPTVPSRTPWISKDSNALNVSCFFFLFIESSSRSKAEMHT